MRHLASVTCASRQCCQVVLSTVVELECRLSIVVDCTTVSSSKWPKDMCTAATGPPQKVPVDWVEIMQVIAVPIALVYC